VIPEPACDSGGQDKNLLAIFGRHKNLFTIFQAGEEQDRQGPEGANP
jgi:hypothetical protein